MGDYTAQDASSLSMRPSSEGGRVDLDQFKREIAGTFEQHMQQVLGRSAGSECISCCSLDVKQSLRLSGWSQARALTHVTLLGHPYINAWISRIMVAWLVVQTATWCEPVYPVLMRLEICLT